MSFKMPFPFPIIWTIVTAILAFFFPIPMWVIFLPWLLILAFMLLIGCVVFAVGALGSK